MSLSPLRSVSAPLLSSFGFLLQDCIYDFLCNLTVSCTLMWAINQPLKRIVDGSRERDGKSEGGLHHHLSDRLKAHLRALKQRPAGNISQHRKSCGRTVCSIRVYCCEKQSVSSLLCDITPDTHTRTHKLVINSYPA